MLLVIFAGWRFYFSALSVILGVMEIRCKYNSYLWNLIPLFTAMIVVAVLVKRCTVIILLRGGVILS